jgi:hypothetical protein
LGIAFRGPIPPPEKECGKTCGKNVEKVWGMWYDCFGGDLF